MHGARTASAYAATVLGTGKLKIVPEGPQQAGVRIAIELDRLAVDLESDHITGPLQIS